MKTRHIQKANLIVFPAIVSAMGGAESITETARYAFVKLPGVEKAVRIPQSQCPPAKDRSAFNMADLATEKLNA